MSKEEINVQEIPEDLKTKIEFLELELEDRNNQIAQLQEKLADSEKANMAIMDQLKGYVQGSISIVSGDPAKPYIPETVAVGDVHYKFLKPAFSLKGRVYTAQEAACNEDVLRSVLAIEGQNILQELV